MIPVTVVIALACVCVKVTVHLALGIVATRNRRIESIFAIVAWAQAVRIIAINASVTIIIGAVAALIGLTLTSGRKAQPRTTVTGLDEHSAVGNGSQIRNTPASVIEQTQIICANR